jgi:uncharacterized protein YndB with AHSA1/START domain
MTIATSLKREPAQQLMITRIFNAPRELVFRMWVEPEHIRQWSCPKGYTVSDGGMDVRAGGRWRATMHSPNGEDLPLGGTYHEVTPPERLVFTHAWFDGDGKPGAETLVTVTLTEVEAGKTRLDFHQTGFASHESRDGHHGGWSECFDKLELHLAEETAA